MPYRFAVRVILFFFIIQASNVLSVTLNSLDELNERQLVVHFEVLPQVEDDNDLLCNDVTVLESLVSLPSDDGSTSFNDDPTANVNLTLPVSINMNELLSSSLEVVDPLLAVTTVVNNEPLVQMRRGKVKIPALKRQSPKSVQEPVLAPNGSFKKVK